MDQQQSNGNGLNDDFKVVVRIRVDDFERITESFESAREGVLDCGGEISKRFEALSKKIASAVTAFPDLGVSFNDALAAQEQVMRLSGKYWYADGRKRHDPFKAKSMWAPRPVSYIPVRPAPFPHKRIRRRRAHRATQRFR